MKTRYLATYLAVLCTAAGCDDVAMRDREAAKAQREADEAKRVAEQRVDAARLQAELDVAKAQEDSRRDVGRAQGKADQRQSAADSALFERRNDYIKGVERDLESLSKRRRDVEAYPTSGPLPQQAVLAAALKDVTERESVLRADLKQVQSSTAASFEYAKSKVERGLTDLKKALDDLERRKS
jgi:hypothetical protein